MNFSNPSVANYFDVTPTASTPSPMSDLPSLVTEQSSPSHPEAVAASGTGIASGTGTVECSSSAMQSVQQLIEDVICGFKRGNVHYFK